MTGIIYKYTSPSGKIYIGQTTNEKRRRKTFLNLNKSYGGIKINNARNKYKPENFTYEIIISIKFTTKKEATKKLDELEELYIHLYNSYLSGYNMTYGGYTNRGFKYTDEQKQLMSLSRIGKKLKPRNKEQKSRQSELMKLKWQDPKYRKLRDKINKSPEYIQKLKKSVTGEKNGMYGKTHTIESRLKMSESRFGEKNYWFTKSKSEEYRKKISQSLKEYNKTHIISQETRNKISSKCSTSVEQYSIDNKYIKTYNSITLAGKTLNIDSSGITKCCKNKRKSAGGYKWKYKISIDTHENNLKNKNLEGKWITTKEAISLTGKCRNVLYYHIKVHSIPKITFGRNIKIHKDSLIKLFNLKEEE